MGVFPNQRISDDAGAWHGSEIAHVFGNIKSHSKVVPATSEQIKVSELMNTAWATFAKDPENGLLKLGWPLYNEKGKNHLPLETGSFPNTSLQQTLSFC
jgi:cholinesterase